jgi:hypothetical protein
MKLVKKGADASHLHILKDLLESNGIPAFINGENTARVMTPFIMTEPGLWIYLDEQFDEALKLLKDPDYEVRNRVNMEQFYGEARKITGQPERLNNALVDLAFTMGLVVLALLVLIKFLQWLAP